MSAAVKATTALDELEASHRAAHDALMSELDKAIAASRAAAAALRELRLSLAGARS